MYIKIILLVSLFYYANCILYSISVIKGPTDRDWKQYKSDFNKTYETKDEEQKRFKIFKQNWIDIQKHNKRFSRGQETYSQEINSFGDFTEKEFTDFYKLKNKEVTVKYSQDVSVNKTQGSENGTEGVWDWREAGAVTSSQNQANCGSSWAFCAVGVLEGYHFRKSKQLLDLSEQHIIDCSSNSSCSNGDSLLAFQFVKENGIYLEKDYGLTSGQGSCKNVTASSLRFNFHNPIIYVGNDEELKEKLVKEGPLAVNVYASYKWMFYKSGVWYNNECSPDTNHCLLLVGYGTEDGVDYWLLKNSWGRQWGLEGFFKLARNKHENYCGLRSGLYLQ